MSDNKPTARQQVEQFVVEWCHAAGAPTGYVTERLAPLLDAFRREVIAETESTLAGEMYLYNPPRMYMGELRQACRELESRRAGE